MRFTCWLPGMVAAAALAAPAAAYAQPRAARDDVEAQHTQGNRLRAQGRNAEARDLFRGLWERTHEPRAIIRQGLAEMALEEWLAADEHLRAGMAVTADPWVVENRARVDEQLRVVASHVGALVIECAPAGAAVFVNDAARGACPLAAPIRMLAGAATVRVELAGMTPVRESTRVVAGDDPTTLRIHLQPVATAPAGDPFADARASNRRRGIMLGTGGALLGVGVVGIGLGAVGFLATDDAGNALSEPLGIVGFAAGGVLTIAGVALLIAAPSRRPEGAARYVPLCAPTLGRPGVACALTF